MTERQSWLLRFRKSPAHTQANIVCTAIIALATVFYTLVAGFQLIVMRGTLSEMKRSGEESTRQMWSAISNINWLARSADWSQKVTQKQASDTVTEMQKQTVAQEGTSREMRRSAGSVVSVNRPWIVPDFPPQHKRFIQEANLEWHNAGKTPAVAVFSTTEYFIGDFPRRLRGCPEMEKELKSRRRDTWQQQGFVAENGRYETGLAKTPPWTGPAPLKIHGCVWYFDIVSNSERSTEFFYEAFDEKFAFPPSEGISLFYLQDHPFVYK